MTISIESNEDIQGAPQFSVVCSNLSWDGDLDDDNNVAEVRLEPHRARSLMRTSTLAAPTANGHGGTAPIEE